MFHRTVSAMMLAIDSKLDSDNEFWFYISMLVGNSVRGHLGSLGGGQTRSSGDWVT